MPSVSFDFSNRVAFVTGGASGIGKETVKQFCESGAQVAIADIDTNAGASYASELVARGYEAVFVELDVTDAASVNRAVDATVETFGQLDFGVNSAGIFPAFVPFTETNQSAWQRAFAINVEGVFLCMKAELMHMRKQQQGVIVNMSSGAGLQAVPLNATYCATKHAVLGLSKSAALEVLDQGIRINSICPAGVDTPMTAAIGKIGDQMLEQLPMTRLATATEVAHMTLFACSDEASYSTGVEFRVNGGTGLMG